MKTIVISGVGPTFHIYDELSKHFSVAVYDQASAQHLAASRGGEGIVCPFNGAQAQLFEKARNDAINAAVDIVNQINSEAFSVNGNALNVRDWLPGMTAVHLGDIIANLRALDAYADSEGVEIVGVIIHEDVTAKYRALALWGLERGVPVIHIPHNNIYLQATPDIHDESVAGWILAASSYMRQWYAKRGFPRERIRVTGFPAWDGWHDTGLKLNKKRARAVLQLEADKTTIHFCTGWAQNTNAVDDHSVIEAAAHITLEAARRKGWQLIWKLHPGDRQGAESDYANLAASYRVPSVVTRDHLAYCLKASDIVLSTGPSNVLVEAGINNRPPALFPMRGYGFDRVPPWEVGLSVDEVVEMVNRVVNSSEWQDERKKFVRHYAFKIDGKARARVAQQIGRIVNA